MAESAIEKIAAGTGDPNVLAVNQAVATHYATHMLVQAPVLRDIVMSAVGRTLALSGYQS
ncbi:hypothetical protein QZM46_07895 [Burkholderia vietnamiensis]|uniref:Uncharacterized protein n=1 Tax=Burkholderia vietnamiensis TaxID=60552 RepID=A0AAW7T2N4_BURVI|nr:hypothetical protein [Burkholderia vietnamiensis]MBH9645809.1 hypothetical protein [Burkholderia vietnamiensis]MBR8008917.1 hypothetical protein [Burkholderia vietnamiensis]MDN7551264.1 hypothetical protein [Burkholderia vietnamiensis]MDN7795078.1 hypothetical protein [Burkholderia vietnamiensis]MDN8044423.1 hypothetical protein [Burkholderia vietnamiensis]